MRSSNCLGATALCPCTASHLASREETLASLWTYIHPLIQDWLVSLVISPPGAGERTNTEWILLDG